MNFLAPFVPHVAVFPLEVGSFPNYLSRRFCLKGLWKMQPYIESFVDCFTTYLVLWLLGVVFACLTQLSEKRDE